MLCFFRGVKFKIMSYTQSEIKREMHISDWKFWKVGERKTNGVDGYEIHWSEDGECITDHVYTKEDADLIAASPLMLETLKYLKMRGGLGLDIHSLIDKAINCAEGRTA
jgi:hypothetical protein